MQAGTAPVDDQKSQSLPNLFRECIESGLARRTETDQNSPHLIDGETANTCARCRRLSGKKRLFEPYSHDQHDKASRELSKTLHSLKIRVNSATQAFRR